MTWVSHAPGSCRPIAFLRYRLISSNTNKPAGVWKSSKQHHSTVLYHNIMAHSQYPEVEGGGSLILAWQVKNKKVLVIGGGEVSPTHS